jgi:DNA-binding transcriptional LysR family regulator
MEIRRLQYFVVVAEELHFTRAADRLNMSQPPLSQQIKMLEAEIGAQLLQRTKRSVSLTPAGRALYEEIVPVLATLDSIAWRVRRISEGEERELNIACSFSTSQGLLPQVVMEYHARHPRITLKVNELPIEMQLDAITKGIVDVGFLRLPVEQPHLSVAPLYEEALMVALPASHFLATRKQLSLVDLKNETFLKAVARQSSALFESVEALCLRAGFVAKVAEVSSNLNTALGLVGVGMGIALIPESMSSLRPTSVVYRPLRNSPHSAVAAVWRRDNDSLEVQLFIDLARSLASTRQDLPLDPLRRPAQGRQ